MSDVTAKEKDEWSNDSDSRGKIFVVGIGPGDIRHLTPCAMQAIHTSSVIVGYKRYVDLIAPLLENQRLVTSGMTEEINRCREALELAKKGEVVSLISSGDPGIYGMAGLVLELNDGYHIEIEIVPGISAVNAAASLIGAPLMNDFVVLSLSDLLTPWEVIENRIRCAAEGDFVIAIYNPKSKKRVEQILMAKEIMGRYRPGKTPVAIVTNAYRKGESIVITDLQNFTDEEIGMLSVVFVGNSKTVRSGEKLITSRGYQIKSDMKIPSKEIIIKRLAEDYLLQSCDYLFCHKEMETCNLCFCIFYPCEDTNLGEYKISRKGTNIWSCMKCEWIHRKETLERLRVFLTDEKNHELAPGDMYIKFVKTMETEG